MRPHFVAGLVTASRPLYAKRLRNEGGKEMASQLDSSNIDSTSGEAGEEGAEAAERTDTRNIEKDVTKELARLGLADLTDEVLKQGEAASEDGDDEAAASGPADPFDLVLQELADLQAKGQLLDFDVRSTYERFLHKKSSLQDLTRDIERSAAKLAPDQRSFLEHFVEFVKPVDVEAEAAAAAAAAAKAARKHEEAVRERETVHFTFAPGDAKKLTVGKSLLRFSQQDQKQFLPEGVAGQLKNTQFKFGDESVVFRRAAYDLIQELKRRQDEGFLSSAGNDSLILSTPRPAPSQI
jgi:hypothetical protein